MGREGYEFLAALTVEATERFEAQAALVQDLSDHFTNLHRELQATRDEFGPFSASLSGISEYSSCNFVVDFYDRTRQAVCGSPSTLSGLVWFATCLALVPVFSIGLMITTMCINCRIGGIGQPHHNHIKDIHHHTKRSFTKIFNRKNVHKVKVAPHP